MRVLGRLAPSSKPLVAPDAARWAIDGAYQRVGQRLRITARIVEVATELVVHAARVDGLLSDLFALQDQLSADLRRGLPAGSVAGAPSMAARARSITEPVNAGTESPALAPVIPTSTSSSGASEEAGDPGSVAQMPATVGAWEPAVLDMIAGPPPPIAPDVITRDETGGATVRAIALPEGIRLDGRLDEPVYHTVTPITGLIQQVPDEGAAATEKTDVWVMFDEDHVYVSARVWDSAPPSEWVANEMRRDATQISQNDNFAVVLDTFYDHRNGFFFYTNPLGALVDMQFTNEGSANRDWNPVWDVRTGRFEGGWTVEMEIPFKSLRYRSAPTQLWSIQFRRTIRRKNEFAYLTPIPISLGPLGIFRMSNAATLVGMRVPRSGLNLDVKPYGIGGVRTDLEADPPTRNVEDGDFGVDAKFGIAQSLTADFTYNTDFAQVEVDEQRVNLTRFSLFFPEKREFFLEGQGIFEFARGTGGGPGGGGGGGPGGGGGGGSGGGGGPGGGGGSSVPILFFSRRIGLEGGGIVPVVAGGRVTGKVGAFDVGALNIQTDDVPTAEIESTNFTTLRLRRDILKRSTIGGNLHEPVRVASARRGGSGVWHRWDVLVLREPADRHVTTPRPKPHTRTRTTPAITVSSSIVEIGTRRSLAIC